MAYSKINYLLKYKLDKILKLVYYLIAFLFLLKLSLPLDWLGSSLAFLKDYELILKVLVFSILIFLGIEFVVFPQSYIYLLFIRSVKVGKISIDILPALVYIVLAFSIPFFLSNLYIDFSFLKSYCLLGNLCKDIILFFSLLFLPSFIVYHIILFLDRPKEFSFKHFLSNLVWVGILLVGYFYFFH